MELDLRLFHDTEFDRFSTGAISHETRQYIHLKVDMLHVVLFKSKDDPFASGDS